MSSLNDLYFFNDNFYVIYNYSFLRCFLLCLKTYILRNSKKIILVSILNGFLKVGM